MDRTIILVDLYWTRDQDPRIPLGHASLLASLRAVPGLTVIPVVFPVNQASLDPDHLADIVLASAAGPADSVDVAIGVYVWAEELVRSLLRRLRRRGFRGRIILGGPQISYTPAGLDVLYPEADAFVRGYGEGALSQLAHTAGRCPVPGVHWAGDVDRCERASVDLERLPSPWLTGVIPLQGQRFIRWETLRGCPFRCNFCQHREPGARLRRRELDRSRIHDEIALFCSHDVRDIAVLDPIFNVGDRATDTLRAFVGHHYGGRLSLQCRAENVTEPFLEAARLLDVRLEFGLQTIHHSEGAAIDRRNNMECVDRALASVRRDNLAHEVSLIFGLPEQTLDSFLATVRWCLDRRVPVIKAFPLMLLRGTALERDRGTWGLQESGGSMPFVVASNTFDEREWRSMARISEALAATEGNHPTSIEALMRLADDLEPTLTRWQPAQLQEAA